MVLVNDLRGEHRQDLAAEVVLQKDGLLLGEHREVEMLDPLPRHIRREAFVGGVLLFDQRAGVREDRLELFGGAHEGLVVDRVRIEQRRVGQGAHPDHEELVEVAAEDREELQPLEQRNRPVARLFEHAQVELQPAEFAVLVEDRVRVVVHIASPRDILQVLCRENREYCQSGNTPCYRSVLLVIEY